MGGRCLSTCCFFSNPAHASDRLCTIQHSGAISFSAGAPINLKKHGGPTKGASPYSGIALVFLFTLSLLPLSLSLPFPFSLSITPLLTVL